MRLKLQMARRNLQSVIVPCKFNTDRTLVDPTHYDAFPYCTGFQRTYTHTKEAKHTKYHCFRNYQQRPRMITGSKPQRKKLHQSQTIVTMPCTNASPPNPLLALFIRQSGRREKPSKIAQQMRFYNGKATVIGDAATFAKFIHNGKYKVPDLPSNNGSSFTGTTNEPCATKNTIVGRVGKGAGQTLNYLWHKAFKFLTMALPKC